MKSLVNKGFTLIEFVVIISIFAIMAGVALVNFAGFRSNVGLNNLSHDIALTIRQAQVFGWATQTDTTGGTIQLDSVTGNPVRYADGVYFKYENNAFSKDFILYTKNISTPGAEYYVDSHLQNGDHDVDTIKIQGPNHISAIHYAESKDILLLPADHTIPAGNGSMDSFSVAFSRPHPEALFFSGTSLFNQSFATYVGIYISADTDAPGIAQHVITISRFGEIAVQ